MLVGDAAVGAVYPGVEVGDRAVRAWEELLAGATVPFGRRRWS
jgi:hypothetical protein